MKVRVTLSGYRKILSVFMSRNEDIDVKDYLGLSAIIRDEEDFILDSGNLSERKNIGVLIQQLNNNYNSLKTSFISIKNKIIYLVKEQDIRRLRSFLLQVINEYPSVDLAEFNIGGLTLLHYAAYNNLVDMIDMLTEIGMPIDLKNNDYIDEENVITQAATPLIFAIKAGACLAVRKLIAKGANINVRYHSLSKSSRTLGLTPLHAAAYKGDLNMVKILMNEGVEINSFTNEGNTPLHAAASCGNKPIVKFLLNKGAIIFIKNNAGFTASELALSKGNSEIVRVFDNCHRMQAIKYLSPICICVLAVIFFI
ncbi:MAG: ankyrin repeat protein 50-like [Rickettsiaceae bacterium]|jgi:ankyrin repeat protein|nr:ankyrin repeat protein 50-like [Rickettsiaceae bacterium]